VFAILGVAGGMLLAFACLQERSVTALALWGAGFVLFSFGSAIVVLSGPAPEPWLVQGAGALALLGYGAMWSGARTFEGRRPEYLRASLGALFWLAACQVDAFVASAGLRMRASSVIIVIYTLLTAREILLARDKELMSRWPAIALLVVHATFFSLRIPMVEMLPFPGGTNPHDGHWLPVGAIAMLLHCFCLSFLVMNMAKERAELQQRRAALLDPLTGVANRRAFVARAERQLQRSVADGKPVAVLLLDLDLFKQINDAFGHQAGDHVLCAFCETANAVLRPDDVFGRLGGEEFACLLPGASALEAMRVAERIRASFEERKDAIPTQDAISTVSVGVATTQDVVPDLTALMVAADRALYAAKANGRNRVERVPSTVRHQVIAAA
jgi:diguanylate cyclase (GGDEF)-like protein